MVETMTGRKDIADAKRELKQMIKEQLDIDEAKYQNDRDKYSSDIVYKQHCGKCRKIFELDEFYVDKSKKNGLSNKCKSCIKAARKKFRESKKSNVEGTK